MKKVKVLIVDDANMSREMLKMVVEKEERYEVVDAIKSARFSDVYIAHKAIDLVLMDILMPDGSFGLAAAKAMKRINPDIKIIAITSMPEVSWIKQAKAIGIESFWYKDSPFETLINIIKQTMNGAHIYPETSKETTIGLAKSSEFTERELDVLRQMTTGASNSIIAQRLCMSENTVKTHIRHLLEKTGCENRTELAIKARLSGLVISDED